MTPPFLPHATTRCSRGYTQILGGLFCLVARMGAVAPPFPALPSRGYDAWVSAAFYLGVWGDSPIGYARRRG